MQNSKRKLKVIKLNRLEELPLRLGFPLKVLEEVADNMQGHYKSGLRKIGKKERLIFNPDRVLRIIHKKIERELLDRFEVPEEIQGGIVGRSTRTNALKHVGKNNIARFDLSNFYPSVSSGRIYKLLRTLGCAPEPARLLARLTTAQGQLPQGFSTSPKLAGLILLRAGARINGLIEKYRLTLSIWIDDLVLSGNYPIKKIVPMLEKIIQEEGFKFNNKTSFASKDERQTATGAVVNKKLGVSKERAREMRRTLHRIKVMGLEAYGKKFHPGLDMLGVKQKISGDLGYMISINRDRYEVFQKEWKTLSTKKTPLPQ